MCVTPGQPADHRSELHPDNLPAPYNKPVISNEDECSLVGMEFVDELFPTTVTGDACLQDHPYLDSDRLVRPDSWHI